MSNYEMKIIETVIKDGVLKAVKYRCKASDEKNIVETEGNWNMQIEHVIDSDTTEHLVAHWVDLEAIQDGKHLIKYRLQEQLDALSSAVTTRPPWAVDTFKVTI
jgi:hypothetical protein